VNVKRIAMMGLCVLPLGAYHAPEAYSAEGIQITISKVSRTATECQYSGIITNSTPYHINEIAFAPGRVTNMRARSSIEMYSLIHYTLFDSGGSNSQNCADVTNMFIQNEDHLERFVVNRCDIDGISEGDCLDMLKFRLVSSLVLSSRIADTDYLSSVQKHNNEELDKKAAGQQKRAEFEAICKQYHACSAYCVNTYGRTSAVNLPEFNACANACPRVSPDDYSCSGHQFPIGSPYYDYN
jgi:hypothetical protein